MTLTRAEFDAACKAVCTANNATICDGTAGDILHLKRFPTDWTWHEHSSYPGLGYLSRSARLFAQRLSVHTSDSHDFKDTIVEEQDEAVLTVETPATLICQQYVAHSATYQVPVFYFSVHKNDGQVLALTDIMSTTLFRPLALPDPNTAHGITAPAAAFAMLSQGDHPTLGTPCWYLHPCHTAEVVEEILKELVIDDKDRSQRYLEAWFMVLSNMITWN